MKPLKILTVVGARPQIIKAAALSRAIRDHFAGSILETILHTGQHYDENMSAVFFDELNIPRPDINLQVGSGSHGVQTARMTEGIEKALMELQPDMLVLYGDTNSTLAGAIAAAKLNIRIAHIEAGLRSFNKTMPEEINRIVCDHCSTFLFSPTRTGYENLLREGFREGNVAPFNADNPAIFHCGDVMYDNSLHFASIAEAKSAAPADLARINDKPFILCTIHRNNNTDDSNRLNQIFRSLLEIATQARHAIYLPMHPRTRLVLEKNLEPLLYRAVLENHKFFIAPPASFLEMTWLESRADMVITDSGGVQKEAYFFGKPCIILRDETEWKEIVEVGAAKLSGANNEAILLAYNSFIEKRPNDFPEIFGDGKAAAFICSTLLKYA
ncbi:MAG: UDP-N-acetylglucosamine 2-epimerase (non-hydrolyzing) [Bacteroidia bacterium]|jgi:UDP-GlcNAc3NAcA epimerase|nr:UDP-N-acetylglucosamine 2-epimerase (non-hydrolyzing) [Bacteroidia bacterium]